MVGRPGPKPQVGLGPGGGHSVGVVGGIFLRGCGSLGQLSWVPAHRQIALEAVRTPAEGKLLERAVASSAHTRPCPTRNSTAGGAAPECFPSTEPEISETLTPALQRPCRSCREVEANGGPGTVSWGSRGMGAQGRVS